MASTVVSAIQLPIVKTSLPEGRIFAMGIAALASGTVELDTGLSLVESLVCTSCNVAAGVNTSLDIQEDFPVTSGTVTVDGTTNTEGSTTAEATTETFCWFAIGFK